MLRDSLTRGVALQALSPELVSWTHTEATCSWEFGFRYAGGCAVEKSEAKFGECAAGCLPSWVGDRTCDRACNVTECEYDGGDCIDDAHLCAAKCPSEWLGDGVCDAECATVACDHDGGGECRCQLHVHLLLHLHLRLHIRLRLRLRLLASTPAAAPASRLPLDDRRVGVRRQRRHLGRVVPPRRQQRDSELL